MTKTLKPLDNGKKEEQVYVLGNFELTKGEKVTVEFTTKNAGGMVHADAVQILPK